VAGSARRKAARTAAGLAGALAAALFLAWSLVEGLDGLPPEQARNVLRIYRLPRLWTAFFTGGVLSVAGLLYQTVFRNPMASPYTLGTASGAAFGAYLAVALGGCPLPVAAFAGALLSIGVVRVCAGRGGAARLLLSGIACGFLFSAASMLVQYRLSPEQTYSMVHWGFGSIVAAKPGALALLGGAFAAALLSGVAGRPLDALLAGDGLALSFGVPVRRVRTGVFLFAALLTACAVSVCGPVAFVGLVVPHLVRLTAPGRHARTLPLAAVYGGLFLAVCDTLPRVLFGGLTPPVGVVTAVVGAPALLALLRRR
jgi:iron complex transport system permease protein